MNKTPTNTKKKSLKWRLASKLTMDDVERMLKQKIINEKEAKELLFNEEDSNEKMKALEKQVEFLERIVEQLSSNRSPHTIVKYIQGYRWPTWYYANGSALDYGTTQVINSALLSVGTSGTSTMKLTSSTSGAQNSKQVK